MIRVPVVRSTFIIKYTVRAGPPIPLITASHQSSIIYLLQGILRKLTCLMRQQFISPDLLPYKVLCRP
jgi:hypothetical protein